MIFYGMFGIITLLNQYKVNFRRETIIMTSNKIRVEIAPTVSHGSLIKFQFIYRNLKSAERRAADYCLQYPEDVANLTISEIARKVGCSEATLVRLARHLGYNGYPELRADILRGDQEDVSKYVIDSSSEDIESIAENMFNLCILYLQDSLHSTDMDALKAAANLLLGAKRFVFVASGDAHFVAASCAQKFMRLGYVTTASTDFDSQLLALSLMDENDVLICISHSGRTRTVCDLAKIAHDRGINVISVTNFPVSPLAKNSDIILLTASFAYDMMDEVVTKRVPALCLLDTLYIYILLQKKEHSTARLENANDFLLMNKL